MAIVDTLIAFPMSPLLGVTGTDVRGSDRFDALGDTRCVGS
ncbi:hypothetical protein SAMN04488066_10473 [Halorubrum aquaticum]|uniref:Uncharacterized protein n=1 Tax=Halorubrum aquaticum TaxID=387340 RepID=A0A1I3A4K2_9EURY|nr:hypothetical protein SAMN04488066_10473 [Halorubrum aquaticum]